MEKSTVNAIEVIKLTKRFGPKTAVSDLSFEVPQATITGFIGPNGAGKTTTLRMLATLLNPDSGSIRIFGHNSTKDAKFVRHNMGFMPDYFGLYEDMEVGEYLDFFAAAYNIPLNQREQLVPDILALLDLSAKTDALVRELSRGMQQRLSLGRSLIHDPKLLLLDEPASGLDPRARFELMGLLRELRNMGKTIFISSHILAELKDLCDFVVIIENGKLIYNGRVIDATASLTGAKSRLRLIVRENAESAAQLLQSRPGVATATTEGNIVVVVEYDPTTSDSGELIKILIMNDYIVQEAIKETVNLEDVFMTLTHGGIE